MSRAATNTATSSARRTDSARTRRAAISAGRRGEHRRDHDRDDGPPVVGLGDHVPEFLRRPVKVPTESE